MPLDIQTDIRNGARYTLRRAVLVYSDGDSALATLHHPRASEGGIELGPGEIAGRAALAALAGELIAGAGGDCAYLDPRVLAHGVGRTVWWTPAAKRPLHLAGAAAQKLPGLSGRTVAHPPLVFTASGRDLRVHALAEDRRPSPETALMHAPYLNLYPGGRVCLGSARVPDRHGPDVIDAWESAFFDSAFSHANPAGGHAIIRHRGGALTFWGAQLRRPAAEFPRQRLLPAGLTLDALIAGRTSS